MNMTSGSRKPLTQSELILRSWSELRAKSVGSAELKAIADLLRERFGEGAISPAAIARVLADEGLPLRHPEVLDYDTIWRDRRLNSFPGEALDFNTLEKAILAVETLGRLSVTLQAEADTKSLTVLRSMVLKIHGDLELIARSTIVNQDVRAVAAEACTWLTVWLQNPAIFEEWLALRRLSSEFIQKFNQ